MSSDITTPREALEKLLTLPSRVVEQKKDAFQNNKIFEVEVISEVSFYGSESGDPESIVFEGDDDQGTAGITKGLFKGRILDENMSNFNFLDIPENSTYTLDPEANNILKSLHPTVVFTGIDSDVTDLKEGDVVLARAKPGSNKSKYDLQFLEYVRVRKKNSSPISIPSGNLRDLFAKSQPADDVRVTDVHAVYWFGGQPPDKYGANFIDTIVRTELYYGSDFLIITGEYNQSPESLIAQGRAQAEGNGFNIVRESLGGWSGGAKGVGNFLKTYPASNFERVVLADPAPYPELTNAAENFSDNMTMHYNLTWWQNTYKDWWGAGFSNQHAQLVSAIEAAGGTVVHDTKYDKSVVGDPSGINGISVSAHKQILIDQLIFILNGSRKGGGSLDAFVSQEYTQEL